MPEQSIDPLIDPARAPSHAGVLRAMEKISALLPPTPLLPLEIDGQQIWCKAESLQPVGAFKIRGAWHRMSDLTPEQRARGVVGVSSGNHAQGVAWAARHLGIAATIVMPSNAPQIKITATRALGADVVFYDRAHESRDEIAAALLADATHLPAIQIARFVHEPPGAFNCTAAAVLSGAGGILPPTSKKV